MDKLFTISEYQNCYILRCNAGARQDIFEEFDLQPTGTVIEAVVFYFCDENEIEEFPIEFDSDLNMFAAYSENLKRLTAMADMLNASFADDTALRDAISSENVQEAVVLENSLNSISSATPELYKKLGLGGKDEMSPEDISDVLKKLF